MPCLHGVDKAEIEEHTNSDSKKNPTSLAQHSLLLGNNFDFHTVEILERIEGNLHLQSEIQQSDKDAKS